MPSRTRSGSATVAQRRVTFAGESKSSDCRTSYPHGILMPASHAEEATDPSKSVISQLFEGSVRLSAANLSSVSAELVRCIASGFYLASDTPDIDDALPTQEFRPPMCLEVYSVLHIVLRAGSQMPSGIPATVREQVNVILQGARRDLELYKNSSSVLDLRVPVQIFRVFDLLLSDEVVAKSAESALVRHFSSEAIAALLSAQSSKALVGACIHLFSSSQQPRHLTESMAQKLLVSMTARAPVSSAALSAEYLSTFKLILQSHRAMMGAQAARWVPTMLQALFDSNSFLRQQALAVLHEINRKTPAARAIAAAIHEELGRTEDTNVPFALIACHRMNLLLGLQGEARSIMSAWSGILLSLSVWGAQPDEKVESWRYLPQWLEVAKTGFNSNFLSTKEAAINSWKTAVYIFAFNGRSEHASKNLHALLHPFKMVKSSPYPLVKRFEGTLSAILYIATRVAMPAGPAHNDVVWSDLIVPALHMFFESDDTQTCADGVKLLIHLISASASPAPMPPGNRTRVLQGDIELEEVGRLPNTWVMGNTIRILDFLSKLVPRLVWQDTQAIWSVLLDVAKQAANAQIHETENVSTLQASLAMFLLREGAGDNLSPEQLSDLAVDWIGVIGLSSLSTKRYNRDGTLVTVSRSGTVSLLDILMPIVLGSSDPKILADTLGRLHDLPSSRRRFLYLLAIAATHTDSLSVWSACTESALQYIRGQNEKGIEAAESLVDILFAAKSLEPGSEMDWGLWVRLLSEGIEISGQHLLFINVVGRTWPQGFGREIVVNFPGLLASCPGLGLHVVRNCVSDERIHATDFSESSLPEAFRVDLARQLVLVNSSSSLSDFEMVMRRAVELLGPDKLVVNADVFLSAVASFVPTNREIGLAVWEDVFCGPSPPAGHFTEYVIMTANQLYADGRLPAVPSTLPILTPRAKRPLDMSTSSSPFAAGEDAPPSSPTEQLDRVKRLRSLESIGSSFGLTPPVSSDDPALLSSSPGSRSSKRSPSERPHSSDSLAEFGTLSPVVGSSPPRIDSDEASNLTELGPLLKSLMTVDIEAAIARSDPARADLVEKLMMDHIIRIRVQRLAQAEISSTL